MSVKWRVTLWFTGMMLLLTSFILVALFVVNGAAITGDPQGSLILVVTDNASELTYKNGGYVWDDIDLYKRGVYTVVFSPDGERLYGTYPAGADIDEPFTDGAVRLISSADTEYYIYDVYNRVGSSDGVFLRGIISSEESSHIMNVLLILLWALVPSILALSVGGGWLLAWGAFRPMEKIVSAANSISDGDDLSKRIDLKKGPREMRRLGKTFDSMFDRLEKSFAAQKQFTSDASHELRTPITVISAECDRSMRKDRTPEDYRETVSVISEQADRMAGLIDQLLNLTRISLGTDRYPLKRAELGSFVSSVCGEFLPKEDRGISLTMDIEEGIFAECNLSLLSSALYNLLQNAYRYGKDDGHVCVALRRDDDRAEISVSDDGQGIAPDDIGKVFDRFWQADPSRADGKGSGLGLALVRETAILHGGSVSVSSEQGKGSTFYIRLPLSQ